MTYPVTAHVPSGRGIHTANAATAWDAVRYMVTNSRADFVDGYSIGGFGFVTIKQRGIRPVFGWLDTGAVEFREGDEDALLAAIEARAQ